jgi:hypothetical protein
LSFDGVVYNNNIKGDWVHVDLHGAVGNPCSFWGVATPVRPMSPALPPG